MAGIRDATDEYVQKRIVALTLVHVTAVLWLIGVSLAAFVQIPLAGIPFFCIVLVIHTCLFITGP